MTGRRELTAVVVGVVVGAGLVLVAASRVWYAVTEPRPAPLPPAEVTQTGASLVPALPALALVALACASGLVATRGVARRLVGALLGIAAIGIAALVVPTLSRPRLAPGWPVLALAGAAVIAVAAVVALRHGDRWPTMGSRYGRTAPTPASAPGEPAEPGTTTGSETGFWDALDRGEDPTRSEPGEPGPPDQAAPR